MIKQIDEMIEKHKSFIKELEAIKKSQAKPREVDLITVALKMISALAESKYMDNLIDSTDKNPMTNGNSVSFNMDKFHHDPPVGKTTYKVTVTGTFEPDEE